MTLPLRRTFLPCGDHAAVDRRIHALEREERQKSGGALQKRSRAVGARLAAARNDIRDRVRIATLPHGPAPPAPVWWPFRGNVEGAMSTRDWICVRCKILKLVHHFATFPTIYVDTIGPKGGG